MAKKGALKSTLIVTSDELKVNGGRWLLQSGPAIRVRGFNSDSIGDRKIIGGDALPIYVLAESDARVNGGQFLLKGGQPIQVTDVIGSARGVIQGKAIPVWPVDDDGNYDADFAGAFTPASIEGLILWLSADTIIGLVDTNPVALWPDQSGNGNDAIQGTAGKQPTYRTGIINGLPIVRFDGIADIMLANGAAPTFSGSDKPMSIIIVVDQANNAALVSFITIGNTGDAVPFHEFDANAVANYRTFRRDDGGAFLFPLGVVPDASLHLLESIFTGTVVNMYRDAALMGAADQACNVGVMTVDQLAVGARRLGGVETNWLDGDLAEVIIYDSALSDANRILVENYLNDKWAIF